MLKNSKVAVLDLTHGGIAIARKLRNIAGSVTAIDVYGKIDPDELEELENEGIRTSKDAVDAGDFDVLIAPVHLDPDYKMLADASKNKIAILSHHAAVGRLLSHNDLGDKSIIEITGTRAKTSTAILLAGILSRKKKVISHTSRGLEDWSTGNILKKGLSITPASLLTALDVVHEAEIEPDIYIFEISLGGTGCANIGVITTVSSDYRIANNTGLASEAKRQMILNAKPGSTLVINHDALRSFGACRRDVYVVSFSDNINASCNVYYEEINSKGGMIAYYVGKRKGRINIRENPDYDMTSYKTAFVCATAVALAMNIDGGSIELSLNEFRGIEGRMRKICFEGRTLIDNSNSGMDISIAENALLFSKREGEHVVMVLGEEAKEVCEGLAPSGVKKFMDKHLDELDGLILVGERMKPFVQNNINKIYYADDLSKGIKLAAGLTGEKDIILSCVKCFR